MISPGFSFSWTLTRGVEVCMRKMLPEFWPNLKCVIVEVICLELAARIFSKSIPGDAGVSMSFVPFLELRPSTPVCIAISIANEVRDILPSYFIVYDYHGVEICDTCWIVVGVGVGSIGETAKRGVGHVNQGGIKSRSNCKTCVTWL
jgi:hypothetical protein